MAATDLDGLDRRLRQVRARAGMFAARAAFRTLPRLARPALEMAAAGLQLAPPPRFFSTHVRQIAPTLNDDLLELYGRGGQVVAGRFAFFNSLQAFEHGMDWEPPQSPAWRAELHAFDYALDLASLFRISREEEYARRLRYMIAHWVASNPPARGIGWQPHVLARRVRNWMLSADLARDDWERDGEFTGLVGESIRLQLAFLLGVLDALSTAAARLDASRALLCASRYFAGSKAREVGRLGFDLLVRELADSQPEPWPQARLLKAQTLMEWHLWSGDEGNSAFLRRALQAALDDLQAALSVDGSLPLLGPEARLAQDDLSDLAALAAVSLNSEAWKSLAGKFGILPYLILGEDGEHQFDSLAETDWAAQDGAAPGQGLLRLAGPRQSSLVAGAHLPSTPEEHRDFTSYELMLNGHRLVVDSGGFAPGSHEYFPRAQAHNVLLVDGQEPRWHDAAGPARAELKLFPGASRLQLSDPGYAFLGVHHQRFWFRLDAEAWLIVDRLEGAGVHRCASLLHFYPTFEVLAEDDRFRVRSRARNYTVIPVGDPKPATSISRGDDAQFPGWYSPEYGVKFPAAVLALEWAGMDLPWVGGILIAGSTLERPTRVEVSAEAASVRLELAGTVYDLPVE